MKLHKKTGIPFRPLILTTAVGFVCQNLAMAQSTPTPPGAEAATVKTSPFLPRPPHLYNEKTVSKAGVPPNVMLLVDDSGSMQAAVGTSTGQYNNWAHNQRCTFNENNNIHWRSNPNCYLLWYTVSGSGVMQNYAFREQTRIGIVIDAIHQLLNDYGGKDKINWSIYSLWGTEWRWYPNSYAVGGGRNISTRRNNYYGWKTVNVPEPMDFTDDTAYLRRFVNSLSPFLDTPTTDRYVRAARKTAYSTQYRCQKSYIIVLSDGDANVDEIPGSSDENVYANKTGFLPWEKKYYGTFKEIKTNAPGDWDVGNLWFMHTYPNGETHGYRSFGSYDPVEDGTKMGIGLFSHILVKADLWTAADGVDKEGGSWDEIQPDGKKSQQNIYTYTIGFQQGMSSRGRRYMRDAGACPSGEQCFFEVSDGANAAAELQTAFRSILKNISGSNSAISVNTRSTSTPAVSGSSNAAIAASVSINTDNWSSMLLFNRFSADGKEIKQGDPVPAEYPNRTVLVNNGKTGGTYYLSASDTSHKDDFGIVSDNEFTNAFVPWLMRDPSKTDKQIQDAANNITPRTVTKYRERTPGATDKQRQMGDVLGSPVVSLGKDSAGKQKYVITAANDGMTYIFESTGSSDETKSPYNLVLNYLPAGMQRESSDDSLTVGKSISATAEDGYGKDEKNNPHLYLNNGGLSWVETADTGGLEREYVLFGTLGQGGRGGYALSVAGMKRSGSGAAGLDAGASAYLQEVPLWETEKGANNGLGYTVSQARIAQVATEWQADKPKLEKNVRLYTFLANGYRPGTYDDSGNTFTPNAAITTYDSVPTLYVYDMMGQEFGTSVTRGSVKSGNSAGTLVKKITVPASNGPGALSSPTVVDVDFNGIADVAYAGDQFGNLYRFDLRDKPDTWKAHMIYQGKATQPITSAPAVYRKNENEYIVVFGTGSDVFKHDQRSKDQQIIMGIYDNLQEKAPSALSYSSGSIIEQSFDHSATEKRHITDVGFDPTRHKGWRILLNPAGKEGDFEVGAEKVVSSPQMLLSTAFLSTRTYKIKDKNSQLPSGVNPEKTCYIAEKSIETKGNSWSMAIDVFTGAGPNLAKGAYYTDGDKPDPMAGKNEHTLTSGTNIIDTANALPTPFATNENGEIKPHGRMLTLGEGSKNEGLNTRNDCLAKTAEPGNLISKAGGASAANGPNSSGSGKVELHAIGGKKCGDPSLFRANEREIQL